MPRTYAIGDIHGCLEKLERLLARCLSDVGNGPARFVFLGSVIDYFQKIIGRLIVCKRTLLASVTLLSLASAANAASDDLVFCSKLGDKDERIACYNAAASIARVKSRPTRVTLASTGPIELGSDSYAKVPARTVTQPAKFHGPYVAIGGTWGVGEQIGPLEPDGPSGVVAVGTNLQSGAFVLGAEIAGRYGAERDADSILLDLGFGPQFMSEKRNHDASLHALVRPGFAIDDTMIFVHAGFGGAHIKTWSTFCLAGCFSIGAQKWYPSALMGSGIEHNIGRAFARLTGEAEAVRIDQEFYWTARAKGMVGWRF
jgi:opacity protein-like surface antigen